MKKVHQGVVAIKTRNASYFWVESYILKKHLKPIYCCVYCFFCTSLSKYIEHIAVVIVYLFAAFQLHNFDDLLENDANFYERMINTRLGFPSASSWLNIYDKVLENIVIFFLFLFFSVAFYTCYEARQTILSSGTTALDNDLLIACNYIL